LAIASYNAGAKPVWEWIQRNGDPREKGIDLVKWVELIPYGETRTYVQRVLSNLYVYRQIL
jgi:soluble lytic murein transglycosylase